MTFTTLATLTSLSTIVPNSVTLEPLSLLTIQFLSSASKVCEVNFNQTKLFLESKESIKFYIDSESHSDHNLNGLLGFTLAHDYTVVDETSLIINNEVMEYHFDHFENCLRLSDSSIESKLARHQLSEDYLLGVPFEVAFLSETGPK